MTRTIAFLVMLISLAKANETCGQNDICIPDSFIQQLFDKVYEQQVRTDDDWIKKSNLYTKIGSYNSVLKANSHGDTLQTAQRWAINVDQPDVFIPIWVSILLLEAHYHGVAPKPSDEQIISNIDFSSSYMDKMKPYNSSLIYFWRCFPDDDNKQTCSCRFPSSYRFLDLIKTLTDGKVDSYNTDEFEKTIRILKDITHIITGTYDIFDVYTHFLKRLYNNKLPPDIDTSSMWIIYGSTLKLFSNDGSPFFSRWIQYNSNISSYFNAIKEFAYRPFSSDPAVNSIDPTTYYVIRHFLDEEKSAGKDVALATTWLTNSVKEKMEGKPLSTNIWFNDVDLVAESDFLNALTMAVLSGLVSPDVVDADLSLIYESTSELFLYLINTNYSNRIDLAVPYYTSPYQIYYIVSRTVSIMDMYKRKSNLPLDVMERVFNNLRQAMEGEATKFIISTVKHDDDRSLYFDDFLGNGDVTDDNEPILRGEARIFSTALAANALMCTWLSYDMDSGFSQWKSKTPQIIKDTVSGSIAWLVKNALDGKFKPWNSFFTGDTYSRKKFSSNFIFPHNIISELPFNNEQGAKTIRIPGMQGYVTKSDYESLMNSNVYGNPSKETFNGFNDPMFNDMTIWLSEPFTYAATLLAVSKYQKITVGLQD